MSVHEWGHGETDAEAGSREEMNANLEWDEWVRELDADRLGRDDPVLTLHPTGRSAQDNPSAIPPGSPTSTPKGAPHPTEVTQ